MPSLLSSRIRCFYCGSKSRYAKGTKVRSFQCASCEGTNFFDENGDLTDVPHDQLNSAQDAGQRYTSSIPQASKGTSAVDDPADALFCASCIKNQRFLADCLAKYLPDESDPRYAEFEAEYPQYRKSLEKRYPQVCAQCEPRVRAKLKRNSYAAKANNLAHSLEKSTPCSARVLRAHHASQNPWRLAYRPVLLTAEVVWWASLLVQGLWHVLGLLGDTPPPTLEVSPDPKLHPLLLEYCIRTRVTQGSAHPYCHHEYSAAVHCALMAALAVLWWNPTLLRAPSARKTNQPFFYGFQCVVTASRYLAWKSTKTSTDTANPRSLRGAHAITLVLIAMTISFTHRIIVPAPKKKVHFRNLDAPLVDPDSIQYPQVNAAQPDRSKGSATARFDVGNLATLKQAPMAVQGLGTTPATFTTTVQSNDTPDDVMDWEPSRPTSYELRPRSRGKTAQVPSHQYPTTSAFSSFPTENGISPFYGSLPPEPKSLEARLRQSSQKQSAQFKPTTDAKQADWFRKMALMQSAGSWTKTDYVSTVPDPDKGRLELQPGKLKLDSLGMGGAERTGLEDIFGNNFNIEDDSSVKHEAPRPPRMQAISSAVILLGFLVALAALSISASLLLPSEPDAMSNWVRPWVDKIVQAAQGLGARHDEQLVTALDRPDSSSSL